MLTVDIKKKFRGFNLDVKIQTDHDIVGLLGASGCGKSMTLKCIAGIEKPDSGRIVLNNKVLFDSDQKINLAPQKRNVGYLFQNYALFPNMTVEQNIGIGLKVKEQDKKEILYEKIKMLHLEGYEKRYPSHLSGGQQQRVALARILVYNPDVIMLDEPFSALDEYLKDQLCEQLLELLENYNGDTLIVTHSRDEVYKLCNTISIIENGAIVLSGNTADIFKRPTKLVAAKLTGCKNISSAKKISDHKVYAIDWKLELEVENEVPDTIGYIAIRAHNLNIVDTIGENTKKCEFVRVVEGPFDSNVIVKLEDSASEIWINMNNKSNKFVNNTTGDLMHIYANFPSEFIMLLE
jgi:molybdate transport system ATP-binding protein